MAVEREWHVPVDLPERLEQGVYEPVDRAEAQQAFVDAEAHLNHLGGGLVTQPARVEVQPGRWLCVGYTFFHRSFLADVAKVRHDEQMNGHAEETEEPVETEVVG